MKKSLFLLSTFFVAILVLSGQNTATLRIGDVDVTGYTGGETILVPVYIDQHDVPITGWQFYILFDPAVLTPTATYLQNKHPNFTGDWITNIINGNEFSGTWIDPLFLGVTIPPGDKIFDLEFIYNMGQCDVEWNVAKSIKQGNTKMFYGGFFESELVLVDGQVASLGPVFITWTGAISDDWFDPGNWDMGMIPDPATDVIIFAETPIDPVIYGSASTKALTIEAGAILTVEPLADLTTHGLFTCEGNFIITSEAALGGYSGSFIDKAGLAGTGTFEFHRDQVCVESGETLGWHYMTAPIDGINNWMIYDYFINLYNETHATDPPPPEVAEPYWMHLAADPPYPCQRAPQIPLIVMEAWALKFDDTYAAGDCEALYPGTGHVIKMSAPFAGLHTGNYNIPITFTPGTYEGWNLIGNPYPSGIDLDLVVWPSGLVAGAAFYDGCAGNYVYWTSAIGSYVVAPTLGFFVEATVATSFNLTNDQRSHNPDIYWKAQSSNLLILQAEGDDTSDKTYIRFMEDATIGFDKTGDFHKIIATTQGIPQIFTMIGEEKLAINVTPPVSNITLGFISNTSGIYTINAIDTSQFSYIIIEDKKASVNSNLLKGSYSFSYAVGEDPARFIIHFDNELKLNVE